MNGIRGCCLGMMVAFVWITSAVAAPANATQSKSKPAVSGDLAQQTKDVLGQGKTTKEAAKVTKKKKPEAPKGLAGKIGKALYGWRKKAPWVPSFGYRVGFSIRPRYFAPENAFFSPTFKTGENANEVDGTVLRPFVSHSYSFSLGSSLKNFGVRGYMSDLRFGLSWGFGQNLTGNSGMAVVANQVYPGDIGISLGKTLYREKYTGIRVGFSLGGRIPISLPSQQRTLITSLAPRVSVSKAFRLFKTALTSLSLSYGFGASFNFYQQDSGLYNPDYAGIPGLNRKWGMSHSIGLGIGIIRGLSLSMGLSISSGYSFADQYAVNTAPQAFGADRLSPSELASFPMNEGNGYGISIGLSYSVLGLFRISAGYSNFGGQFEYQFDRFGQRQWVLRNPFKLQNGGFNVGLGGRF